MKKYAFGVISIIAGVLLAGSAFATQIPANTGANGASGGFSTQAMYGFDDGNNIVTSAALFQVDPGSGGINTPTQKPDPVPEPSSLMMFGLGLVGLGFASRRLRKRS